MDAQAEYDAFYEAEFRALYQRLLDSGIDVQTMAGVSMLMATFAVSFAAGCVGKVDTKLGRAPVQSQTDEVLGLLREILVVGDRPKPQLVKPDHE